MDDRELTLRQWKTMWSGKNQMAYILAYNVLELAKKPEYRCILGGQAYRIVREVRA